MKPGWQRYEEAGSTIIATGATATLIWDPFWPLILFGLTVFVIGFVMESKEKRRSVHAESLVGKGMNDDKN